MYREMLKQGNVEIYCDVWPCDRECGKFHKPFLNTTKLRQLKSRTESVDQVAKKEAKEKAKGAFEEIMEAAARKNSQEFVEPQMPKLPEAMTLGSTRAKPQITKNADTTTIYFDNPVWDDAKFRHELLDSDDDRYSLGLGQAPYIMADEDTLDGLLRDTHHEITSNPISHSKKDETILSSDDENDYSTLNLRRHDQPGPSRPRARTPRTRTPRARTPGVKYEKSILDLDD